MSITYIPSQISLSVVSGYEVQKVYEGNYFKAEFSNSDIGTSNVDIFFSSTENINLSRLIVQLESGSVNVKLYEGANITSNGTTVSSINVNRLSNKTNSTIFYHGPVVDDYGTLIGSFKIYGNKKESSVGQEGIPSYILNKNFNYLINVDPIDTTGDISIIVADYLESNRGLDV